MDIVTLRKRISLLHASLRNEGHNPLEAVALVASTLESGEGRATATAGLATGSRYHLDALLSDIELDGSVLSIAFQEFLMAEARNGLGQYLTPLPVADFIARAIASHEFENALDPFAGSALLLDRLGEQVPQVRLRGIEINRAAASIARSVGRLSQHNIEITDGDAFILWARGEIPPADAIVTNPPYGAVATTVTPTELQALGVPESLRRLNNIPAELLGLELSASILAEGGTLAIVLPQSVLTNSSWSDYRQDLFKRLTPIVAVSLPEATFLPFKGVANACVLIGKKQASDLPTHFQYLRSRAIGYDDTGRPAGHSDLTDVLGLIDRDDACDYAVVNRDGTVSIPPSMAHSVDLSEYHSLGEIASVFTGRTLGRSEYVSCGPRLLKVGDLTGSFISWKSRARSHIPKPLFEKLTRLHLRVGDVCLTAAAHRPRYIGLKVDLIDELPVEGAMPSAEVLVVRLHTNAPIRPEQLLFYFRSDVGYSQVQELVRGSTAHLYSSDVRQLLIPPLGDPEEAARLAEKFWSAAAAFRTYLHLESEAASLGLAGLMTDSNNVDEEDDQSVFSQRALVI